MYSKTKRNLKRDEINLLFESVGIGSVTNITPLSDGMFNAVYSVTANGDYVLKVSPADDVRVMTYEKNMLKTELFWYDIISKNTSVKTPRIYACDFDGKYVNSQWFIMEKINGVHRDKADIQPEEKLCVSAQTVAQLHNVSNNMFGYVQNGLHGSWYEALHCMISNLLEDAAAVSKKSRRGEKLLCCCEKYKSVLEDVPCTMVNYDLWDSNVIVNKSENGKMSFSLIDPERSMWGDPVFDFLCLEGFADSLNKKTKSIKIHNDECNVKIKLNKDTEIRYAFAQGLMALIQEIEKYYRFRPLGEGWMVDVASSKVMYKKAFSVLE